MSDLSCSPFDLKDFFFRELADPQRLQVEAHIKTCGACREELDRLFHVKHALFAIREEEIPQRIGFVSDPVFEPSPWRRGLASFWNSGPRLGFASAAMLSAALVFFAVTRPAPAPVVRMAAAAPPTTTVAAAASAVSEGEVQARIDAAVARAMAPVEARQEAEMRQVKADLEGARQRLILAEQEYDYSRKKQSAALVTAGVYGLPQSGTGVSQ
jgi:hypothetical protein